jgi:Protein of unknown function (DUF4239)
MDFYWIYDLPNWKLGFLIVGTFTVVGVLGLFLSRPVSRWVLKGSGEYNDVVSWVFAGIGVFYGLALGLIAVGTWEDFTAVDGQVSQEAALLASLYDDLDGYPEAVRPKLEGMLREYTKFIIEKDWPAHRKGLVDDGGNRLFDRFEDAIRGFDPSNDRERIIHTEVVHMVSQVDEARRVRLSSVTAGLPASLWVVVLVGGVLNMSLLYLFWVENVLLHAILVGVFSAFVGLMIFLTAAMDNPFRGNFSVSADAYQEVLDEVMNAPKPGHPAPSA